MPVGNFIFRLKYIGAVLELLEAIAATILPLVQVLFSSRLNLTFTPRVENSFENWRNAFLWKSWPLWGLLESNPWPLREIWQFFPDEKSLPFTKRNQHLNPSSCLGPEFVSSYLLYIDASPGSLISIIRLRPWFFWWMAKTFHQGKNCQISPRGHGFDSRRPQSGLLFHKNALRQFSNRLKKYFPIW